MLYGNSKEVNTKTNSQGSQLKIMFVHDQPLVSIIIPTRNRLDKLTNLINSITLSDYKRIEIIVIDDNSTEYETETIRKQFPNILFSKNDGSNSLSRCRNIGINLSKGDLLFFIDDDNIIDTTCISSLVGKFLTNPDVGVVGPIMYHYNKPDKVWCAGINRSFYTSKTTFIGSGEIDRGQFNSSASEEFPNAFMISRKAIASAGNFNEDLYPFHYGEADICQRIMKCGFSIILEPKAKIWHDFQDSNVTGGTRITKNRTYYYGRNRILFHRYYSSKKELICFYLFELTLVIPSYLILLMGSKGSTKERFELVWLYLRGVRDGISHKK